MVQKSLSLNAIKDTYAEVQRFADQLNEEERATSGTEQDWDPRMCWCILASGSGGLRSDLRARAMSSQSKEMMTISRTPRFSTSTISARGPRSAG